MLQVAKNEHSLGELSDHKLEHGPHKHGKDACLEAGIADGEKTLATKPLRDGAIVFFEKIAPRAHVERITIFNPIDRRYFREKLFLLLRRESLVDAIVIVVAKDPLVIGEVLQHNNGLVHLARHLHHDARLATHAQHSIEHQREHKMREQLHHPVIQLAHNARSANRILGNRPDHAHRWLGHGRLSPIVKYLTPSNRILLARRQMNHTRRAIRMTCTMPANHKQRVGHKVHRDNVGATFAVHLHGAGNAQAAEQQ